MLEHILSEVVADLLGVPLGRVEQALYALRVTLADGLGYLPAVLALHAAEEPYEVALDPLPGLRASEAVAYPTMKFSQRPRPSADGGRFEGPVLREHGAPFLVPTKWYLGYELSDAAEHGPCRATPNP
jgi:hypothetical protein